ncbi:MAG: hypothetical protein NVS1B2_26270 [Vulcanimicrobiaceae bacterium]
MPKAAKFDPQALPDLTTAGLDALPYGIITVDRTGTIVAYNDTESRATGFARDVVMGRNFFADVAPCTQVKAFKGRFEDFLTRRDVSIEPFEFVFPFASGPDRVSILFYRETVKADRISIIVMRETS